MQANKDKSYKINENEADQYHIELTKRIIDKDKNVEDETSVVIMTQRDYINFKKPTIKTVLGYHSARIIHDPTIKPKEKPAKEEPGDVKPKTK